MEFVTLCSTREGQAVVASGALLLLLLSLLSALLLLRRRPPKLKLHLPPRPFPPLPLLGDILHLRRLLQNPASLQSLLLKLGPIFSLSTGRTHIIFITSASLTHEALVEKGRLFAARPTLPSRAFFTNTFRNINSASYGPYWRTMRRNLVQEMLTIPKILPFKPTRSRVVNNLILRIRAEAQQNEGIVAVYLNIRTAMFKLLLFMCFGFDLPEDAILEMSALVDELVRWPFISLTDFYPFLQLFNGKTDRIRHAVKKKQIRVISSTIEKHRELGKIGQLAKGSYLETLLHMDADGMVFSIEDLVVLCTEFLIAGVDTSSTTLEWTIAHLALHPHIQSKLHHEMCDVVGDRLLEETDLPRLPYLQAIIKETLRLHPALHLLLPHAVLEPCKIGGYDIPSGSIVQFGNVYISRDPEIWHEPLMFKPERFLVADVDITGTKELMMVPFGAGRRICPGLGLASIHMELFVGCLVQAFEWSLPPSKEMVDFSEEHRLIVGMKHSVRALVKERNSHIV